MAKIFQLGLLVKDDSPPPVVIVRGRAVLSRRGYFQSHGKTACGVVGDLKTVTRAVETIQARLRVRQTQTLLEQAFGASIHGETWSVVSYSDTKEPVLLFRTNFDLAGRGARGDTVADGVLDDGL